MANRRGQYKSGDRVEIVAGPFEGLAGAVVETKNSHRVVLRIRLLNHSVRVEVPIGYTKLLQPRQAVVSDQLRVAVTPISAEAIYRLAKEPDRLYELDPRKFESLIASLLEDAGYEVRLTPCTRDGGRDILAVFKIPYGETLTVVECKRFAAHRRIGPDIVQRLLFVADRNDKASHAMLATTSAFTPGARALEREYQWRLSLKDFEDLREWLSRFGKWDRRSDRSIWVPSEVELEEASPNTHSQPTRGAAKPLRIPSVRKKRSPRRG